MFQNNNSAIVKQLAKATEKSEKRLTITSTTVIILAVAVSFVAALFTMTQVRIYNLVSQKASQVNVFDVSNEVVQKLRHDKEFSYVGVRKWIDDSSNIDYSVTTEYQDNNYIVQSEKYIERNMPNAENEVLLDHLYAQRLGAKIGGTVSLKIAGQTKQCIVTGFLKEVGNAEHSSDTGKYSVIVSKSFLDHMSEMKKPAYDVGLRFVNGAQLSTEEITQKMDDIQQRYHLKKENIGPGKGYFLTENAFTSRFGQVGMLLGLTIFIFAAAAIVIHSIFYISVSGKIRQYGQLRTIGMTKKQMKKLVRLTGFSFLKKGLPIGLLLGGIGGYFIDPVHWYWPFTLLAATVVASLSAVCILISASSPASQAADASPIEAVRYTAYQSVHEKAKKSRHKITPLSFAGMNFARDKKKAASTLLSLAVGGILFVIVSGLSNSYYPENGIRIYNYPHGGSYAISIENDDNTTDETENQILEQIKRIPGIQKINPVYSTQSIQTDLNDSNYKLNGMFIPEDDFKSLRPYLLEGSINYDEMVKENGIIFRRYEGYSYDGINYHVGDLINLKTESNGSETLKVAAVVSADCPKLGLKTSPIFFFPMDSKSGVANIKKLTRIEVITNPTAEKEAGLKLQDFVNGTKNLELSSFQTDVKAIASPQNTMYIGFSILAIFILIFGLVNYLNTIATNFLVRKRETEILQAVGATKAQLLKMFSFEGLFYMAGMLFSMLVLGTFGLWLMVKKIDAVSYVFTFPVFQILAFTAVLLVIQILLIIYTKQIMQKESLIESIAENE
jgi:putative ABC transport system permease protein